MKNEFPHAKLREVAEKIAPEYPGISECNAWEQLYAISTTHEGLVLAINDLYFVIKKLIAKIGMSDDEAVDYLMQLYKERDEKTNDISSEYEVS